MDDRNIMNVKFKRSKSNPTVDCPEADFELPFYKDVEYFSHLENFVNFVKAVERLVRSSNYYKRYIAYLKEEVGLTYCQVLSNVESEFADVEMHHGPLLTLFDCVEIVTDHMIATGQRITSFRVAKIIMDEHFKHNIQVIMLSKTVHEQVHENAIFINLGQAFGNLQVFLEKYKKGIRPEVVAQINSYIKSSMEHDSNDSGVLALSEYAHKWLQEN